MTKMRIFILTVVLGLSLLTPGCSSEQNDSPDGKMLIFVDIAPLAFFVDRISGDETVCEVLVPPGGEPHTFQPTPKQVARLAGTDLYISAGMPFGRRLAGQLSQIQGGPKIFDLPKSIATAEIEHDTDSQPHNMPEHEEHEGHAHGDHIHHSHDHEGPDPHFWMSPVNAIKITRVLLRELSDVYPERTGLFETNAEKLIVELRQLDEDLRKYLAPLAGKTFFVFHPAFGYFADDYNLHQQAIEIEGKSPSPKQVVELISAARKAQVKVIFVQPQFSPAAAKTIADQIGGVVIPLDPLSRNYIANLKHVAQAISQALGESVTHAEHNPSNAVESSH